MSFWIGDIDDYMYICNIIDMLLIFEQFSFLKPLEHFISDLAHIDLCIGNSSDHFSTIVCISFEQK